MLKKDKIRSYVKGRITNYSNVLKTKYELSYKYTNRDDNPNLQIEQLKLMKLISIYWN